MGSSYEDRQAAWAKKGQAKEDEEREGEVKVGEALGKVTGDIKTNSDKRVRIDNVETLRFNPSTDLMKGDSIRVTIEADWTRRSQIKKGEAKVGEALGKVTGDIRTNSDKRIRIDNIETLRFNPSVDLKKGNSIRVTIEKV